MADESAGPGNVADHMRALADQAVQHAKQQGGIVLDYSVQSLSALDRLIEAFRSQLSASGRANSIVALKVGAYLGEVLCRNLSGVWEKGGGNLPQEMPVVAVGGLLAPTPGVAVALLEGKGVAMGEREIKTATDYFHGIQEQTQKRLEKLLAGDAENVEALQRSMSDNAELARQLYGYLASAVVTAEVKWGLQLDFSEESVEGLENLLAVLHDGYRQPDSEGDPRPSDDKVQQMAILWGAYLGEVVRRHHGGKWVNTPFGAHGPVVRLEIGQSAIFPIAKAEKRIRNGPEDNVRLYYKMMSQRLGMALTPTTSEGAQPTDRLRKFADRALKLAYDFSKDSAEPLSAFLLVLKGDKVTVESYAALDAPKAMVLGRKRAGEQLPDVSCVAFVYDGYTTEDGVKNDTFFIEAHERGAPASFVWGQRYRLEEAEGRRVPLEELALLQQGKPVLTEDGKAASSVGDVVPEGPSVVQPTVDWSVHTPEGVTLDALVLLNEPRTFSRYYLRKGAVESSEIKFPCGHLLAVKSLLADSWPVPAEALNEAVVDASAGFRIVDPDKAGTGDSIVLVSSEALGEPPDPGRLQSFLEALSDLPDAAYRGRAFVVVAPRPSSVGSTREERAKAHIEQLLG